MAMDALDILPPELWEIIFEKVEDPQDWLNLYRTCSTFEDVVGGQRCRALLPKVFPHVFKYLNNDLHELLTLRLASSQWKKAVDDSLDSPIVGIRQNMSMSEEKHVFTESDELSLFLDHFRTHPGNPLIGSYVAFVMANNTVEEDMEYKGLMTRLMSKYGSKIRKLHVVERNRNQNTEGFDNFLRLIISCGHWTPNLGRLEVEFYDHANVEWNPEENKINLLLGTTPLPVISKLKYFTFDGEGKPSSLIHLQNLLVRICCNPETLKGVGMTGIPNELAGYTNLEEVIWTSSSEEEGLELLSMPSWPLSCLIMYPKESVSVRDLVACVEQRFRETLTSLETEGNYRKNSEEESQCVMMNLPLLKHLTIPVDQKFQWHLLANLVNLKTLDLRHDTTNEEEIKQLSVVLERKMLEYNIWEALPKLTKIELLGFRNENAECNIYKVYSREENLVQ